MAMSDSRIRFGLLDLWSNPRHWVRQGGFNAPAPKGVELRTVTLQLLVSGVDADAMWQAYRDLDAQIERARDVWTAGDMSDAAPDAILEVRFGNSTTNVRFDVVDGSLSAPVIGRAITKDERPHMACTLTLTCLPFARGAMQSRTFADVEFDAAAVLSIDHVPGDVPALTRWIITDTSTSGVINRLMLGRFSRRRGVDALDAELILNAAHQSPGASGSESGTIGGTRARITTTPAWQAVARIVRDGVDANGLFRLLARVRDSANILSAPTNLRATPVLQTVTKVQESSTYTSGSGTTASHTPGVTPTAGNTLIVAVGWNDSVITASITAGMTGVTAGTARAHSGNQQVQLFVGTADGTGTITATFSSSVGGKNVQVYEYSGLDPAFVEQSGANGNSTTFGVGSITTTRPSVIISAIQWNATATTPTGTAGWTQDDVNGSAAVGAWSRAAPTVGTFTNAATTTGGSTPYAGVIAAIPYSTMNGLLTVRVTAIAATTTSAASDPVTIQIPQGYAVQLDWDLGSGSPTSHAVYANDGAGWDMENTGSALGTYTFGVAPSSPSDPPAQATAVGAQVKARVALSSAVQWFDMPAVGTRVGNSAWEWLDLGMATLPPMRAHEGSSPQAWTVEVQGRYLLGDLLGAKTLDVDAVALIPAMEDATIVEYPGLNLGTKRQWVIDSRRDGAVSAYLRAVDGTGEHGGLYVANASGHQIAPGSNLVPILGAIAGGVSADPDAAQADIVCEFVPRYRFVTGQP